MGASLLSLDSLGRIGQVMRQDNDCILEQFWLNLSGFEGDCLTGRIGGYLD